MSTTDEVVISNMRDRKRATRMDISDRIQSSSREYDTAQVGDARLDSVIIRNLTYHVGRGTSRKTILNKISLTVPEGSIYGLLGPSGCGKTTMLRCIVGRLSPANSYSSVLVFGLTPGDSRGQVPGRNIGYMPQEISIYEDFTIEETLVYFAKINHMQSMDIASRIDFLVKFLDLPDKRRAVTNLSGGQKRRVSLAAALVHSPPLLILDEPTVGVDPLLRQNIWNHLVTLTQTERISVIITTHYIEEARQAHVVGLMRNGRILAEDSPEALMAKHCLPTLEEVFLHLCMTDSMLSKGNNDKQAPTKPKILNDIVKNTITIPQDNEDTHQSSHNDYDSVELDNKHHIKGVSRVHIDTITNQVQLASYTNQVMQLDSTSSLDIDNPDQLVLSAQTTNNAISVTRQNLTKFGNTNTKRQASPIDYLTNQAMSWAARRNNELNMINFRLNNRAYVDGGLSVGQSHSVTLDKRSKSVRHSKHWHRNNSASNGNRKHHLQWWKTLMAVTWKNYVRLRRNPPVLIFQFMLPAIQVILFCLCIGGEPFDVPVAVVNDESVPRSSLKFLNGLDKHVIRQLKYDNLTSAIDAVRKGHVWGAIHIPEKYSKNLQSRLIMGEDVNNETISNGTIKVYPDLTNLHLALALETTFRETFINFARNSFEEMGYDRSLADLPIQLGSPVYGTLKKDSYLEFMAPGVVVSISYVMATGLTALAFILERRDGLLERSLVSGVDTSQILLAHAINQVVVMIIQIFLVLGCTFVVFEIPSRGPFHWVVILILLQGCTGMAFGLLVSAICTEENTAVMMVVGTFYTNLILAGIIWPVEAMPHWLRPVSYAQPQTLATDTLRHILSRGWGITEMQVILGFVVTLGWLVVFLISAGLIFKYSR